MRCWRFREKSDEIDFDNGYYKRTKSYDDLVEWQPRLCQLVYLITGIRTVLQAVPVY